MVLGKPRQLDGASIPSRGSPLFGSVYADGDPVLRQHPQPVLQLAIPGIPEGNRRGGLSRAFVVGGLAGGGDQGRQGGGFLRRPDAAQELGPWETGGCLGRIRLEDGAL